MPSLQDISNTYHELSPKNDKSSAWAAPADSSASPATPPRGAAPKSQAAPSTGGSHLSTFSPETAGARKAEHTRTDGQPPAALNFDDAHAAAWQDSIPGPEKRPRESDADSDETLESIRISQGISNYKDLLRFCFPKIISNSIEIKQQINLDALNYQTAANPALFKNITLTELIEIVVLHKNTQGLTSFNVDESLERIRMDLIRFYTDNLPSKPKPTKDFFTSYTLVNQATTEQHKYTLDASVVSTIQYYLCLGLANPNSQEAIGFFTKLLETDRNNWGHCLFSCGDDSQNPYIKLAWSVFRANILTMIDTNSDKINPETIPGTIKELLEQIRFRCAPSEIPYIKLFQWRTGGSFDITGQPAPPETYDKKSGFGQPSKAKKQIIDTLQKQHIDNTCWSIVKRSEKGRATEDMVVIGADGYVIARFERLVDSKIRNGNFYLEFQPYLHSGLQDHPEAHSIPIGNSRHPKVNNILPVSCSIFRIGLSKIVRKSQSSAAKRAPQPPAPSMDSSDASPTSTLSSTSVSSTQTLLLQQAIGSSDSSCSSGSPNGNLDVPIPSTPRP